jgi:hypothetical protein
MKTKVFLIHVLSLSFNLLSSPCFADPYLLGEVINRIPADTVPFNGSKNTPFCRECSYPIDNSNNAIPDKLYNNVQCTEFDHAIVSWDLWGRTSGKFQISDNNNFLVIVHFGGITDWGTDVLCVVNPSGEVLDTIEGQINYDVIAIKQYRINVQHKIIISTLTTTSTTSVPLESFTSFVGQRVDKTYFINAQGQFVEESVQYYRPRTYTRTELDNRDLNIWEGNEVPL